jgi:hypothetical protein
MASPYAGFRRMRKYHVSCLRMLLRYGCKGRNLTPRHSEAKPQPKKENHQDGRGILNRETRRIHEKGKGKDGFDRKEHREHKEKQGI